MINYIGLGEDGRVGYAFEQYRTSNRWINKAIYFFCGFGFCLCACRRGHTIA